MTYLPVFLYLPSTTLFYDSANKGASLMPDILNSVVSRFLFHLERVFHSKRKFHNLSALYDNADDTYYGK